MYSKEMLYRLLLVATAAGLNLVSKANQAELPESSISTFGKGPIFRHLGKLVTDKSHRLRSVNVRAKCEHR